MPLYRSALLMMVLGGCDHSAPFATSYAPLGPSSSGPEVRLTFNAGGDSLATWTADGHGILYVFSLPTEPRGNCLGMLPAAGGTQLWSFCDDGLARQDSATSFDGAAMSTDRRLLYFEAVGRVDLNGVPSGQPAYMALWLADSAQPLTRQKLATFSPVVGDINWLTGIAWADSSDFAALGEQFVGLSTRTGFDTLITPVAVVRGVISGGTATLSPIAGTTGAIMYSLAQGGQQVVFATGGLTIQSVPIGGGTPSVVATVPSNNERQLLGFSCSAATCAVLTVETFPAGTTHTLWSLSLATGGFDSLRSESLPLSKPHLSPVSGDIVLQLSGDLFLYKGLLP